jgi:hypothetical protein
MLHRGGRITVFENPVNLASLTSRLKYEASWKDDYPNRQFYADECELLLKFLQENDKLERFWPRLLSKKQQRDEALNEIRVAYFLHSRGHAVVELESEDAPGYTVDFLISLGANKTAFVEVKSPGWEGHDLTNAERMAGRAKRPKYSESIDGRPSRPIDIIRTTVQKWRVKFSGNAPSILFISDDCFINLGAFGYGPLQMALLQKSLAYGDGLFQNPEYSNIGAVFLFWWILDPEKHRIEYNSIGMGNPNALPKAAVPSEMFARLTTRVEPAGILGSRSGEVPAAL